MRSSRILKHFTIYGVLLSFILIGCGEDTGQSASVEEDPIDVGLPEEDAYVCPQPCVEGDQGPIGDVGVSTPAIPEFPQGESAPASGYSMVSAPLTLFDVLADGRILGATQAGITVFDGDQTLDQERRSVNSSAHTRSRVTTSCLRRKVPRSWAMNPTVTPQRGGPTSSESSAPDPRQCG